MRVFPAGLILRKNLGIRHFSDVMIIGAYPQQEGVRPNGLSHSMSEICDCHGVLVSRRGLGQEVFHEGMLEVCVPVQLKV